MPPDPPPGGHPRAGTDPAAPGPPPAAVHELASACVRFVQRALGVRLDYEAETLPVVDHWLRGAREEVRRRPEALPIIARAAGAYFGEVVRRRLSAFWKAGDTDPAAWELRLRPVRLAFSPVAFAEDALTLARGDQGERGYVDLSDADREVVRARLDALPAADEEEFLALSTRLEVLEIAVAALRERRAATGASDLDLGASDYDN